MKDWLKFIGLSFFSDAIAKSAVKRGIGNIVFAAAVTVVFLLLGLIFGTVFTFGANYNNTPDLVATIEATLAMPELSAEIDGGKLVASVLVDTVADAEDREKCFRGYDIVVDTRDADTFDDFTAYCVSKSGKRIAFEEYRALDDDLKTLYSFCVEYSGRERVIDEAWIEKCETYLDAATDKKTSDAYAEIKSLSAQEYAAALYELYVKSYYPDLSAYETGGNAPKTRNYYYHNYGKRDKIIFIFNDSMVGLYTTKFGASHVLYGNYGGMKNGAVGKSAAEINRFIADSVSGANAIVIYNKVVSFFAVIPFTAIIVLATAVLLFCFTKLLKLDEIKFGAAAKIVCSFLTVSSIISALVTFAFGFLVSETLLNWLSGVVLFAILVIRSVVMLIRDKIAARKAEASSGAEAEIADDNTTVGEVL